MVLYHLWILKQPWKFMQNCLYIFALTVQLARLKATPNLSIQTSKIGNPHTAKGHLYWSMTFVLLTLGSSFFCIFPFPRNQMILTAKVKIVMSPDCPTSRLAQVGTFYFTVSQATPFKIDVEALSLYVLFLQLRHAYLIIQICRVIIIL